MIADSCENDSETLEFIKGGLLLDHLRTYKLLKVEPVTCSSLGLVVKQYYNNIYLVKFLWNTRIYKWFIILIIFTGKTNQISIYNTNVFCLVISELSLKLLLSHFTPVLILKFSFSLMASLKRDLTESYTHLFHLCYTYPAEHPKRKDIIGLTIYV